MQLRDYFGHIFLINLPYRTDRLRAASQMLKRMGISLDGGVAEKFEAVRPLSAAGFPNLGAHGCFLSHLSVLRLASQRGYESVLILEDDVELSTEFLGNQSTWLESLSSSEWEWCYLGWACESKPSEHGRFVSFSRAVSNTHAYALKAQVFPKVISYLEAILSRASGHPEGGPMHVDGAFSRFREDHPEVRTLIASPAVAQQRSSRSDIAALPVWDKVPIVRQLSGFARSVFR